MSPLESRDWTAYEERCRKEHVDWLRSLTPADAIALLEDFHCFTSTIEAAEGEAGNRGKAGTKRLEDQRWADKLARRRKQVDAFLRLDRMRSERRASENPQ